MKKQSLSLIQVALIFSFALFTAMSSAHAAEGVKELRICWAGTSSTSKSLMNDTTKMIEATGKFKVVTSGTKEERVGGYCMLDKFQRYSGLYEEFCQEWLPVIEKGKYDYVILQQGGASLNFTPEDIDGLFIKLLPELIMKIEKTGAKVILWEKSPKEGSTGKEGAERKWHGRYPNGGRLLALENAKLVKRTGVKMAWASAAEAELLAQEKFKNMKYLFTEGHPGLMANYMKACAISYEVTGIDPVGSSWKKIHFGPYFGPKFQREKKNDPEFYNKYKDQVEGNFFKMTDEEAEFLQKTAMKHHYKGEALVDEYSNNAEATKRIDEERAAIIADELQFEKYGLSKDAILYCYQRLTNRYPGIEMPEWVRDTLDKKLIAEANSNASPGLKNKSIRKKMSAYWQENNKALRIDLQVKCMKMRKYYQVEGPIEMCKNYGIFLSFIKEVMTLPGYKLEFGGMTEEQRTKRFSKFKFYKGLDYKNYWPSFAAFNKSNKDFKKAVEAWEIYLQCINKLDFSSLTDDEIISVDFWKQADNEFSKRMSEK